MKGITDFSRSLWVLPVLLALALSSALGCGGSSEPVQSAGPATGNQVGDRVHPFTLRLADGSTVTSAELIGENRPTFLIFFQNP